MKRSLFRNLPAVPNKGRPNGPGIVGLVYVKGQRTHFPITYVWVTQKDGSVLFRRAW